MPKIPKLRERSEQLESEWKARKCAICGSDKWPNYPFCRTCTIRLQRIGLHVMIRVFAGKTIRRILRRAELYDMWMRRYDICRDYLWTRAHTRSEAMVRDVPEILCDQKRARLGRP